jgi:hypothetical protein
MYLLPVSPHKPPTNYYKTTTKAVFDKRFPKIAPTPPKSYFT